MTTQDKVRITQTLDVLLRGRSSSKANKFNLVSCDFPVELTNDKRE